MSSTVGDKVKIYRRRAGLSQLDLEVEMDASPGMISRIERGKVKPTAQTLQKISNILDLSNREILSLNSLSQKIGLESLEIISQSLTINDTEERIQFVLNTLADELNLIVISVFKIKEDILQMQYINKNIATITSLKAIGKNVGEISMVTSKSPDNYILRSIVESKTLRSNDMQDFTKGLFSSKIAKFIQTTTNMDYSISASFESRGKKYGFYLTKEFDCEYSFEIELLQYILKILFSTL